MGIFAVGYALVARCFVLVWCVVGFVHYWLDSLVNGVDYFMLFVLDG